MSPNKLQLNNSLYWRSTMWLTVWVLPALTGGPSFPEITWQLGHSVQGDGNYRPIPASVHPEAAGRHGWRASSPAGHLDGLLIGRGDEEADGWHHCLIPCGTDHFPFGPLRIVLQHTLIIFANRDLKVQIHKLLLMCKTTTHSYLPSDAKAVKSLKYT